MADQGISDADIAANLPADSSKLPSNEQGLEVARALEDKSKQDYSAQFRSKRDSYSTTSSDLSVSAKAPAVKHEASPVDPLNYGGAAKSVPGAQIQEQFAPKISGTSTVFHWNYDGSRDAQDPGSTSAFGYNLDDKSLTGVAVPWDVLEAKFGKFTRVVGPSGKIELLDTPEAKAIAARIKSSSVVVTAPDGSRHVFPIVDIQGSMRGHQRGDYGPHALDLTLGAAQEMGLKDNAPVSYSIVPGTADAAAARENNYVDKTSLLSVYKQKFPDSGKDESGNAPSDDEILSNIREKYYPDVPREAFDILARLPGGTKPLEEYQTRDAPPIDKFRAKFPEYKDMPKDDLLKAVWDHLDSATQAKYKGIPLPGMTSFDAFKEEFAPDPWMHVASQVGEEIRRSVIENFPENKAWFDSVGKFLTENTPFRKEMQAGWDQLAPAFGFGKGQIGSDAYEQYRQLQNQFFEWTKEQGRKAKAQAPQNPNLAQTIGASIGGAAAGIPVGIATWGPFAELPGLSIASGALLDMAATYQQEKDAGAASVVDVSSAGITRTVQGLIFSSRAGRIATGVAMAAAGTSMRDATDWLEGRKPNSLDKQASDAALDMLMGVWFKDGRHSKPVQEEIDAAVKARNEGDDVKARAHADRAGVLMTPAERAKNLKNVQDLVKKQAGEPLKPAMKEEDLPESWKPKKNGQTAHEIIQKPRVRVKAAGKEVSFEKVRTAAVRMPDGEIFTGKTHYDAYQKAYEKGYEAPEGPEGEGFLDYSGRFLTREEAGGGKKLYSGDLETEQARTDPMGLIGSKEDIAAAKRAEQKFIGSQEDIAARDKAFEFYNFGFGDPFKMIRDFFARDKGEDEGVRKSWLTLFAPQYLKPSEEFKAFSPESPLTPAQHMKMTLEQEGWTRQRNMNAQTAEWLKKSDLLDNFRHDVTRVSRREGFYHKYSDAQINAMERGVKPMDEGYANMNAIYEHLGREIRAEDARNNYHFSTKNIFPQLIKKASDLKDIDAQLRAMNIDPENLTSEQFNSLMDEIHNLKNSRGEEIALNTYNPEKIWQARLNNTFRAKQKQAVVERGRHEGGYILPLGEKGPADVGKWETIYAPDGKQYRIEPTAHTLWHTAFDPSWFDSGLVGRTAGNYAIRPFNRAKQLTLGLKLFSPIYHTLNVLHAHDTSAFNLALAKFLDKSPGAGRDLAKYVGDQLLLGVPRAARAVKSMNPILSYIRGEHGVRWEDLNDQQKYEASLLREGGLTAKISEEHEKQFIPIKTPLARGVNDLLNLGYNTFANWGGVKQWMFSQMFPSMKMATYLEYAKDLLQRNPDLLNAPLARGKHLTDLGDRIDARFSEINWNNIFWNKTLKQAAIAHLLAPGWTLGLWRMHGGAIHDLTTNMANLDKARELLSEDVNRPTEDRLITNQMLYAGQYMFLAALKNLAVFALFNAGSGAAATFWDAFYPRIGKDANGKDKRLKTPFWINEYSLLAHDVQDKGVLGGFSQFFLWNKLAPTTSAFLDLARNVDFQGNQIVSTMPIENFGDLATRMHQTMNYLLKQTVLPMPFESMRPGDAAQDTFVSFMGIGAPAGKWTSNTALENDIIAAARGLGQKVVSREEADRRAAKREADLARAPLAAQHKPSSAQYAFKDLDASRQVKFMRRMSPDELKIYWKYAHKEAKSEYAK